MQSHDDNQVVSRKSNEYDYDEEFDDNSNVDIENEDVENAEYPVQPEGIQSYEDQNIVNKILKQKKMMIFMIKTIMLKISNS